MLKLAMLLNNAGEPLPETRYRAPKVLSDLGYNGLVLWETTSVSGVQSPDAVGSGEMRRWVEQQLEAIREKIHQASAARMSVYLAYDALTLARDLVSREGAELLCKNRANTVCPGSDQALERSTGALEALLAQLPPVDGVVLRFGDTEARRFPYLIGNDLFLPYCSRCSHLDKVDRISLVIQRFYDLVVGRLNKRLIVRAWNVRPNAMHDSPELCRALRDRLPGAPDDDRLVLSFKFTQTDFWRYQQWNQGSLEFGRRPILYELQCQREFEGKGGIPNWQAPLWRDGNPESRREGEISGLAQVAGKVNLAGLWAWVRGGGWGGPFVSNETWIDANVFAVPLLADKPDADPSALAQQWINQRLGVTDPQVAQAIRQVLEHSPQVILRGFYLGAFARTRPTPWHPNGDFIQDDVIDAQVAWRMIQQVPEADLDEVVREKQEAVDQVARDRAALQHLINEANHNLLDPLVNTLVYTESLLETLRDLVAGLVAYRKFLKSRDQNLVQPIRSRLLQAQSYWQHHTQRHASMPGVATAFRETNLWQLTQRILGEIGG